MTEEILSNWLDFPLSVWILIFQRTGEESCQRNGWPEGLHTVPSVFLCSDFAQECGRKGRRALTRSVCCESGLMCKHGELDGKIDLCLAFMIMCVATIPLCNLLFVLSLTSCLSFVFGNGQCHVGSDIRATTRSCLDHRGQTDSLGVFACQCYTLFP